MNIVATPQLLAALRTAKAQCLMRAAQLAHCRVCGDDQARFDRAVQQLDQLIGELQTEGGDRGT